ncbi:MAG: B12-binding domain-containing radical SAM protein [Chloroflexi bacterium]|nr:B12-binding domain-containing radical SAM protein [Chloroflexota bacterium]
MSKWVGATMPYEVHIPPIGLMYLASYARTALPGIDFRIVESSMGFANDEEFARLLDEFKPDVVGIRSIAFFLEELQRIVALTRTHCDATIVVGGPIVEAYKARIFEEAPGIHLAVKGEGERTLVEILSGASRHKAMGLLYPTDGHIHENEDAVEIAQIDTLPFPAYDLVDLDTYAKQLSYAYNHRRQGVLLTSRGCPYQCTFCFSHWDAVRLRSASNIFQEILKLYHDYSVRDFYVVDDIFNVDLKRSMALFDLIVNAGLKLRLYFVNGLRADIATEAFVDRAIEAGAIWFTYAVESGNETIQAYVRKRLDLRKARHIISYTQKQDVVVNVSTMFGFPTETPEQAQETLDWLSELPAPSLLPYHFCLRFFPGCEIGRQAIEAGWDLERISLTSRFSYNDLPMSTPTLPKQEMYRILLEYHRRFGLNNNTAIQRGIRTLQQVGYSDIEIAHMYSVLKRKVVSGVEDLLEVGGR